MAGSKETPRQKMIGMMYLVLTCLLALNVSKDILKGFVTVNESLERTNASMKLSNEELLDAFRESLKEDKTAQGYYDNAMVSHQLTTEAITYLEQMKKKLIEITESVDKNVADTMRLRFVEKMDDYDTPTFQLIGSDESKPDNKPLSAKELRTKLTELHSKLTSMVDNMQKRKETELIKKEYLSLKTKIDIIKPVDPNEKENDLAITWELQNFYHLPLAAVITNLSKIESDIKNVETEMIGKFAAASSLKLIKINHFEAKVLAPTKYVRSGEMYNADIFLAGSSTNFNPNNMQVLIGAEYDSISKTLVKEGTPVSLMAGMGKYVVPTSGQGEQIVKGVIRVKNALDKFDYYPFEDKYIVAAPVSAVSADRMNVFYTGITNDVSITAAGVAPKDLIVKVNGNNALLTSVGNGKYSFSPVTTGTCEIAVYAKDQNGQLKLQGAPTKFRIKDLPTPFVKINDKYALGSLELRKLDLNVFNNLGADIPGFDLNVKYKVKSYSIAVIKDGIVADYPCPGSSLTAEAKGAIARTKPGSRIFVENIFAEGPDKKLRKLPDVFIKVKS